MNQFFYIILALLLVVLNGFFVAAEFALVKLRQTRVKTIARVYGLPGRILARVHGQLDEYLSACQLGITLASLGLGWAGNPAFADLLTPVLHGLGVENVKVIQYISIAFAFLIISFLHIVVGELAPKSWAIRMSEKVAIFAALPLFVFYWLMYPAIWLLNRSASVVLRVFGVTGGHGHDSSYSADELKLILRTSRNSEKFTRDEWNVMAHTLEFSELDVVELMRPYNEMVSLSAKDSVEQSLERIAQNRYSRYPWLDEQGEVAGVIHIKDLFFAERKGQTLDDLSEFVRPVQFVAPETPALELFRRFREGAPHFAVIQSEGQAPLGFLTLDNLLAALVGEIRDEFRQGRNDWTELDDGTLIGKGSLPIFSLERALGIDIETEEVDSVGGLIMLKLGNVPKEGDRVRFDAFDLVVKRMSGPRILLVRVYPRAQEEVEH